MLTCFQKVAREAIDIPANQEFKIVGAGYNPYHFDSLGYLIDGLGRTHNLLIPNLHKLELQVLSKPAYSFDKWMQNNGIHTNQKFEILGFLGNPYHIDDRGYLVDCIGNIQNHYLFYFQDHPETTIHKLA